MAEKKYEFSDINVEIVVGIEGRETSHQIMDKGGESKGEGRWVYRPYAKPMPVKIGDKFKLKGELIDRNGRRSDIINRKYVHYSTSRSEIFLLIRMDGWSWIQKFARMLQSRRNMVSAAYG